MTPQLPDGIGGSNPAVPPFLPNEALSDAAMTYFYGHLFAAESEIRAMFPAAMDAQRQRFYRALCRIVASEPGQLADDLAALGRAHRKYGVRKEHYDSFRTALQATFRRFAPEARWEGGFDHAASVMIAAAEDADSVPAWWTAEVTECETPVPHVAMLTLRPDAPLPYLPGQHITVQTPHWPRVWRRYSIANAPRENGTLSLHVRAVPGGLVSTSLLHARPGDTLVLGPAEGTMIADTESERDVLCLAGGTGLAPVKAIIEAVTRASGPGRRRREIALYFGARTSRALYDMPALHVMELDYPWLEVVPVTSDQAGLDAMHGTIADIAAAAPWAERDVYISGPDAMIVGTVSALRDLGAPPERLHCDLPREFGALSPISDI